VYANQYVELKARGKEDAALANGTLLVAVAWALHFVALFFLALKLSPEWSDGLWRHVTHWIGRDSGRLAGKVIALPFLGLFYLLAKVTVGRQAHFTGLKARVEALSTEEQKRGSTAGLVYALGSVAVGIAAILVLG
jgi:hypothetical protein